MIGKVEMDGMIGKVEMDGMIGMIGMIGRMMLGGRSGRGDQLRPMPSERVEQLLQQHELGHLECDYPRLPAADGVFSGRPAGKAHTLVPLPTCFPAFPAIQT